MPIRPEHRWFYPIDWRQLSDVIRFQRARGRCEHCILGGALLTAARSEPELADLVARFVSAITRTADRKPFEGLSIEDLIETAIDQNATSPRRPRRLSHKPD